MSASGFRPPLRFDRHELAGAFGDVGTDLPLLIGMIAASGLDAGAVLAVYGALHLLTGWSYRMPMPVQPLKAVAALVIAQQLPATTVLGGGLAIGIVMLALAASGALEWLGRVIPRPVVRGIQVGLGLQLSLLALREYIPSQGPTGYALAAVAFGLVLGLGASRRLPPSLVVLAAGALWMFATVTPEVRGTLVRLAPALPAVTLPAWGDVWTGFLLLAIPQLPLSLGNSLLATRQLSADLFPDRPAPTLRRLGLTYAAMNLVSPFVGGVPVCHGSGGMMGHYAFGGRTGGSVVLYGVVLLGAGLLAGPAFAAGVGVFPRAVLGALLVVEGITLLALVRDLADDRAAFSTALLCGLVAATVPWGYLVAMVGGTLVWALARRGLVTLPPAGRSAVRGD